MADWGEVLRADARYRDVPELAVNPRAPATTTTHVKMPFELLFVNQRENASRRLLIGLQSFCTNRAPTAYQMEPAWLNDYGSNRAVFAHGIASNESRDFTDLTPAGFLPDPPGLPLGEEQGYDFVAYRDTEPEERHIFDIMQYRVVITTAEQIVDGDDETTYAFVLTNDGQDVNRRQNDLHLLFRLYELKRLFEAGTVTEFYHAPGMGGMCWSIRIVPPVDTLIINEEEVYWGCFDTQEQAVAAIQASTFEVSFGSHLITGYTIPTPDYRPLPLWQVIVHREGPPSVDLGNARIQPWRNTVIYEGADLLLAAKLVQDFRASVAARRNYAAIPSNPADGTWRLRVLYWVSAPIPDEYGVIEILDRLHVEIARALYHETQPDGGRMSHAELEMLPIDAGVRAPWAGWYVPPPIGHNPLVKLRRNRVDCLSVYLLGKSSPSAIQLRRAGSIYSMQRGLQLATLHNQSRDDDTWTFREERPLREYGVVITRDDPEIELLFALPGLGSATTLSPGAPLEQQNRPFIRGRDLGHWAATFEVELLD